MLQSIPAADITLRFLEQTLGLAHAAFTEFFLAWQTAIGNRSDLETASLDPVKADFFELVAQREKKSFEDFWRSLSQSAIARSKSVPTRSA